MSDSIGIIFQTTVNKPMAIFLLLAIVFGYAYWDQNQSYTEVLAEVATLRTEVEKTNEIIKLKVKIAEQMCGIKPFDPNSSVPLFSTQEDN